MHGSARRPKIVVSGGGSGVVSHAGSRLLAELADRAGVTGGFTDVLAGLRQRRAGHDPGQIFVDLAEVLADGGTTISDLAVLTHQPDLFGPVASTATACRVLDTIDEPLLAGLRSARAAGRERVWLQAADTSRLPLSTPAGGRSCPGIRVANWFWPAAAPMSCAEGWPRSFGSSNRSTPTSSVVSPAPVRFIHKVASPPWWASAAGWAEAAGR